MSGTLGTRQLRGMESIFGILKRRDYLAGLFHRNVICFATKYTRKLVYLLVGTSNRYY